MRDYFRTCDERINEDAGGGYKRARKRGRERDALLDTRSLAERTPKQNALPAKRRRLSSEKRREFRLHAGMYMRYADAERAIYRPGLPANARLVLRLVPLTTRTRNAARELFQEAARRATRRPDGMHPLE